LTVPGLLDNADAMQMGQPAFSAVDSQIDPSG
jgi:hypothetical protein